MKRKVDPALEPTFYSLHEERKSMTPLLETPRLFLRRISEDDAEFILELLNEPSYIINIGDRGLRTNDDARSYIRSKLRPSYNNFGFGLYLVSAKDRMVPLGISGFVKRDMLEHADIGFAFLERFWGKGYAYEAAVAVCNYGRTVLNFDRILGVTASDNKSSIKLLEKLSLRFERMIQLPGIVTERKLFSTSRFGASAPGAEPGIRKSARSPATGERHETDLGIQNPESRISEFQRPLKPFRGHLRQKPET